MKTTLLIILLSLLCSERNMAQMNRSRIMKVDYKSLVSKADLDYTTPVTRSEEGMPVGNGRMVSLVWTTPTAMHFQINRVDVFTMGCNTNSFPDGHNNYSNGCGYVDINMEDPVIHVMDGWPRKWDVSFKLQAKGGFLVSSSMKGGTIRFVEILSQLGGECRIRNPWPSAKTTLFCNGKKMDEMKGSLLKFTTKKGKSYLLVSPLCWNANAASKDAVSTGLGKIEKLKTVVQ